MRDSLSVYHRIYSNLPETVAFLKPNFDSVGGKANWWKSSDNRLSRDSKIFKVSVLRYDRTMVGHKAISCNLYRISAPFWGPCHHTVIDPILLKTPTLRQRMSPSHQSPRMSQATERWDDISFCKPQINLFTQGHVRGVIGPNTGRFTIQILWPTSYKIGNTPIGEQIRWP